MRPTSSASTRRLAPLLAVVLAAAVGCSADNKPPDASVDSAADLDAAADVGVPDVPDAVVADMPPATFFGTVKGRVVAADTQQPLAGAIVRFGGRAERATTGSDGRFALVLAKTVPLRQLALVAGREGYFNGGIEVIDPTAEQTIALKTLPADNPSYAFKHPDELEATPHCLHCHHNQTLPWQKSGHRNSAQNPKLHDLYNGTASGITTAAACTAAGGTWKDGKAFGAATVTKKCYVAGGSVLADVNPGVCGGSGQPSCDDPNAPAAARPTQFGSCADCHAPTAAAAKPGATDLNGVAGTALTHGVQCDFCHKIQKVTVNGKPGVAGAIKLLRAGPPGSGGFSNPEVMFGPLGDVIVSIMGASYQPQFSTSELCSACHQWLAAGFRPADKPLIDTTKWPGGLPIQDTYYEWTQSPAATAKTQCQNCHMPSQPFQTATEDLIGPPVISGVFGWARPYGEVRDHSFLPRLPPAPAGYVAGPGDPSRASLRDPLTITVTTKRTASAIDVEVSLANDGAGHSIPTGTPSRQLLLLVRAEANGSALPATGGYSVPPYIGALISGSVDTGAAVLSGNQLTLPPGKSFPASAAGKVVRFVAASGAHDDYPGTRWFGAAARTAVEKGLPVLEPAGVAVIAQVAGATATLDRSLVVAPKTRFFVGDSPPSIGAVDGNAAVTALAGAPGYAFSKVMVDKAGKRGVAFFRAVDIAADNRIPAGKTAKTTHRFNASTATGAAITVTVELLYRKYPYPKARERGWKAVDVLRARRTASVAP